MKSLVVKTAENYSIFIDMHQKVVTESNNSLNKFDFGQRPRVFLGLDRFIRIRRTKNVTMGIKYSVNAYRKIQIGITGIQSKALG